MNDPKSSENSNSIYFPIRVKRETYKIFQSMLEKANEKEAGKRIKADDLLSKALQLVREKDFEELRKSSLTHKDRFELAYLEYCKKNGSISRDDYLGVIMSGENTAQASTASAKNS